MKLRLRNVAIWVLGVAATIAVWQLLVQRVDVVRIWISSPVLIARFFGSEWDLLGLALLYTAGATVAGLSIALVAGTLAAVLLTHNFNIPRPARAFVDAASVTPMLVVGPFLTLVLPVGFPTAVAMTALVCFFAYTRLIFDAFTRTPASLRDLARLYGIPRRRVVLRILLPYHLRAVYGAVRSTVPLAITGAVVAEMFGARHGLGRNIFEASVRLNPELFVCSTTLVICLGVFFNYLVALCEQLKVKG